MKILRILQPGRQPRDMRQRRDEERRRAMEPRQAGEPRQVAEPQPPLPLPEREPEDPPLDLFRGRLRMFLWTVVVALPPLAVVLVPWAAGKVPHPGPARIVGSPELVLTGVLLAIAGVYDLIVTPLRTSATAYKFIMTGCLLGTFFPAFIAYLRVAKVPEELPDTLSVALVLVSFGLCITLGSLSAWAAAKG
ncbi:hypothetical protein ABT147_14705 [Streptomyces sp. NPDC001868]|uniref:hypothetical protein n=1 Tax=Streptomyces sp. NPDC001868 TaxID=3154401 RepID=UPI0033222E58